MMNRISSLKRTIQEGVIPENDYVAAMWMITHNCPCIVDKVSLCKGDIDNATTDMCRICWMKKNCYPVPKNKRGNAGITMVQLEQWEKLVKSIIQGETDASNSRTETT